MMMPLSQYPLHAASVPASPGLAKRRGSACDRRHSQHLAQSGQTLCQLIAQARRWVHNATGTRSRLRICASIMPRLGAHAQQAMAGTISLQHTTPRWMRPSSLVRLPARRTMACSANGAWLTACRTITSGGWRAPVQARLGALTYGTHAVHAESAPVLPPQVPGKDTSAARN